MKFQDDLIAGLCIVGLGVTGLVNPAFAEYKIRSPLVESGEIAIEHVGSISTDSNPAKSNEKSDVVELEVGVTDFWTAEIEGEWGRDAGQGNTMKFLSKTLGSKFQPFQQGELWLDVGLWTEYGFGTTTGGPDSLKFGPLLQKSFGDFTVTGNYYFDREVGHNAAAGMNMSYGAQFKYDWMKWLEPAVEVYGELGTIEHAPVPKDQKTLIGPVLTGKVSFGAMGELKYEVGYLAGITTETPANTVKWLVEYEIAF
jgi:hypothetical protein